MDKDLLKTSVEPKVAGKREGILALDCPLSFFDRGVGVIINFIRTLLKYIYAYFGHNDFFINAWPASGIEVLDLANSATPSNHWVPVRPTVTCTNESLYQLEKEHSRRND